MRKLERILAGFEVKGARNSEFDRLSLHHILCAVAKDAELPDSHAHVAAEIAAMSVESASEDLLRRINTFRHRLRRDLGLETGEWDLVGKPVARPTDDSPATDRASSTLSPKGRVILPHRIFLEDVRSPYNVGAIFRTAESFGVAEIILSPECASPEHPRAKRSAMGTIEVVPWRVSELRDVADSGEIFLLETGGIEVAGFRFPADGTMVVGSEELGASPDARKAAKSSGGTVSIGTGGLKASLNVSVAVGIALYRWFTAPKR